MCIWDVGIGLLQVVPTFGSWYAISLPKISVWPNFCIVMLCLVYRSWTMVEISSLWGWLCWDERRRMWLLMMYMMLSLWINMYVFCDWSLWQWGKWVERKVPLLVCLVVQWVCLQYGGLIWTIYSWADNVFNAVFVLRNEGTICTYALLWVVYGVIYVVKHVSGGFCISM